MRYFVETYGCQMNRAESAAYELILVERRWSPAADPDEADLVLINTCSVRATAETRALGRIAHYAAKRKRRNFTLLVVGCMAERLHDQLSAAESPVDYVLGTSERARFPAILEALENGRPYVDDGEKPVFSFASSHLESGSFRSFVPIMHGCNNFCTYCIVPYVRGRELSRQPSSIMAEIDILEEQGVREITLLGQNVNSYRWDDEAGVIDFPDILAAVAERAKTIRWIRFLSSHPKDFSPRLIAVMRDHRNLCRHIHLCVQHGSDRVLNAMNRRYTRDDYLRLVDNIRTALPDVSLSTDILIGFPGETEDDVDQTLDLMKRVRFLYAYMYHYNPREGTAAYSLPDRIPDAIKKERLARVIALQTAHTKEAMKERLGQRAEVLVETYSRKNSAELLARTERDEMVVFPGKPELLGSFTTVDLLALRGNTFRAKEVVQCHGEACPS